MNIRSRLRPLVPLCALTLHPAALNAADAIPDVWKNWNVQEAVQRAVFLPTCTGPYQVESGDLNGDGHPDLTIPCRGELLSPSLARPANDQLTVYLNPGSMDGKWQRLDFPVGFGPYHSAIGDLDGDGLPDVAVPNFQSNDGRDLAILYGAKDRTKLFEPTSYIKIEGNDFHNEYGRTETGEITYPTPGLTSTAIADLNGDGLNDIVTVAHQTDLFFVLLNEGNRQFRQIRYPQQSAPYDFLLAGPRDIAVSDFDGDGHLDLAFSMYESNLIEVWKGNGKGGFTPWRRSPSFGKTPYHLKVGDLDGDSLPDVVVGNRSTSDNVVVLRNGADRFKYAGSYRPQSAKRGEETGDEIRDVYLTDIDGDGTLDLAATARISGKVIFWRGTGDPTFGKAFTDRRTAEFPGKGPRGITRLRNEVAVILYNSNELAVVSLPVQVDRIGH